MFWKQKLIPKSEKVKKIGVHIIGFMRALECFILLKDLLQKVFNLLELKFQLVKAIG